MTMICLLYDFVAIDLDCAVTLLFTHRFFGKSHKFSVYL